MSFKRFWGIAALLALLTLLVFPASASTVSFLVVETGLNEESPHVQYSSLWEGGLMETFFNAGHIVTNSPILRMKTKPAQVLSGALKEDFDEAYLGGVDYFILGFLCYKMQDGMAIPFEMAIRVYSTAPQALVFERTFPAGSGRTLNEEYQFAQNAGRVLASQIRER